MAMGGTSASWRANNLPPEKVSGLLRPPNPLLGLMVIWKLLGHSTAREGRFRRDMAGLGKGRPGATFRSIIFSKKACAWL